MKHVKSRYDRFNEWLGYLAERPSTALAVQSGLLLRSDVRYTIDTNFRYERTRRI